MIDETKLAEPTSIASLPRFENPELDPAKALVPQPTLEDITLRIKVAHADAIAGLAYSAQRAIAAGELLIKAKEMVKKEVGHGAWEDYLTLEIRIHPRMAQTYMKLYREKDQLKQLVEKKTSQHSFFTQTSALRILRQEDKKTKPKRKTKPSSK